MLSAAGVGLLQPRRGEIVAAGAARPAMVRDRSRVTVVGGGLAGIAAAFELATRGCAVTLLERGPALGGKLGGWPVRALGETFPQEHGFHGFFSHYYNLQTLLDAADVGDDALVASPGYPVLYADRPPERFGRTTGVFPVNLLAVLRQSANLGLADFHDDGAGIWELMRYDEARTFARFDDVDFRTFCRTQRINAAMVDTVLAPFGKTTLNRLERLSAAEAIRFFHFYFMGNPEGLGFRYTRRDAPAAILAPLHRRLTALGVDVRAGTTAHRLVRDADGITHVVVGERPRALPPTSVAMTAVAATGWTPIVDGARTVFVRRSAGAWQALDGRCTHQGCTVALDPATGGFRCPCHAGTFDADGRPTSGPPPRPLDALPTATDGDRVRIARAAGAAEDALPCDHCIVATDVRGLQAIVAASALDAPAFEAAVGALGVADPYVVLRVWLDRPVRAERDAFYTVAGYRYVDSLAIYSHFQEPFIDWARRTGGAVVELHAYAIAPDAIAPEGVVQAAMLDEMVRLLPELTGARVRHAEYMAQHDFTRWAPGDHARRPRTATPIANLFLAGDHVRLDAPAALMEAAVMSGRVAANGVLRRCGAQEIAIPTVAPRGPLSWL